MLKVSFGYFRGVVLLGSTADMMTKPCWIRTSKKVIWINVNFLLHIFPTFYDSLDTNQLLEVDILARWIHLDILHLRDNWRLKFEMMSIDSNRKIQNKEFILTRRRRRKEGNGTWYLSVAIIVIRRGFWRRRRRRFWKFRKTVRSEEYISSEQGS